MKFIAKSFHVDAEKYEGGNASVIMSFLLDGKPDYRHLGVWVTGGYGVKVGMGDGIIKFPSVEGMQYCRVGDWVVKDQYGRLSVMREDKLRELYDEVKMLEKAVIEAESVA